MQLVHQALDCLPLRRHRLALVQDHYLRKLHPHTITTITIMGTTPGTRTLKGMACNRRHRAMLLLQTVNRNQC
jgi:hypothetical protein